MSISELQAVYNGKELPEISDRILLEATDFASANNCSVEDALLYILDMMIEKPFGE